MTRWHETRPWHTNVALSLIGVAMIWSTRQLYHEHLQFYIGFSGVSGMQLFLYLGAILILLIRPANVDRYTLPMIFAFAIACRVVALIPPPFLSTDIYRYVWDGIVQHAGINPYRYVPGDQALAFLRAPHAGIYWNINRREYAHTIYPPVAQMVFYLVTWISPTAHFMKIAMVMFEGVTVWGLMQLLRELGVRREWILVYLWLPMLIWEFAGSGHVDSVILAFLALAMLARYQRRPVLVGLFLGLAVLTKFYPLVLFPAFWMRDGRRVDWKMPATMAGLAAAGYAVYLSAGKLVLGFMGGYVQEEGIESGSRYFLLQLAQHVPGLHNLPNTAFIAFAGVVMLGLAVWAWRRAGESRTAWMRPAMAFAMAMMLLFSPHYPWYIAWLAPFMLVTPSLTVLTYIGAMFYLCTTALAQGYGPKQYELNEYLYGAVAIAFVVEMALRKMAWTRDWYGGLMRRADS